MRLIMDTQKGKPHNDLRHKFFKCNTCNYFSTHLTVVKSEYICHIAGSHFGGRDSLKIDRINACVFEPSPNVWLWHCRIKCSIEDSEKIGIVEQSAQVLEIPVIQMFLPWPLEAGKRNIVQWLHNVWAVSRNGHHLDVIAQHVLQKRVIINMTLMRVNDKEMSSIQQSIPFQEKNKPDSILMKLAFCNIAIGCGSHPSTLLIGEPRLVHMSAFMNDHGRANPSTGIHKGENSACLTLLTTYLSVSSGTLVPQYLADCWDILNPSLISWPNLLRRMDFKLFQHSKVLGKPLLYISRVGCHGPCYWEVRTLFDYNVRVSCQIPFGPFVASNFVLGRETFNAIDVGILEC